MSCCACIPPRAQVPAPVPAWLGAPPPKVRRWQSPRKMAERWRSWSQLRRGPFGSPSRPMCCYLPTRTTQTRCEVQGTGLRPGASVRALGLSLEAECLARAGGTPYGMLGAPCPTSRHNTFLLYLDGFRRSLENGTYSQGAAKGIGQGTRRPEQNGANPCLQPVTHRRARGKGRLHYTKGSTGAPGISPRRASPPCEASPPRWRVRRGHC
jgi:hypothetical protein